MEVSRVDFGLKRLIQSGLIVMTLLYESIKHCTGDKD